MHTYLAVTDNDWFHFLRSKQGLEEVNFWQPSGRRKFQTLDPGEPFLFKLHAPENFVVGGGFFATLLPAHLEHRNRPNQEFLEWHADTQFRR